MKNFVFFGLDICKICQLSVIMKEILLIGKQEENHVKTVLSLKSSQEESRSGSCTQT